MGVFQLYVDESGRFSSAAQDLVIAGVLVEGYATPQLDNALRQRLEAIFVGVPYPAHAAHHNVRSSLLWGPLGDVAVEGPSADRFRRATAPATNIARSAQAGEATAFRVAVAAASSPKDISYPVLSRFDHWLQREHLGAYTLLAQEAIRQRADLGAFLARDFGALFPRSTLTFVAAWQERDGLEDRSSQRALSDRRYVALYEALIERAAAFVAGREGKSQLWVHLAGRSALDRDQIQRLNTAETTAIGHPLLARARAQVHVVRTQPRAYGGSVPPGIVLADFTANSLGFCLRQASSWSDVATAMQREMGITPEGRCRLLSATPKLPAVEANGQARKAVHLASQGKPAQAPRLPLWAHEQAVTWISAIEAEARQ